MARTSQEVSQLYCPENFVDRIDKTGAVAEGKWRDEVQLDETSLEYLYKIDKVSNKSCETREYLKSYFMSSAGKVPWQDNIILHLGKNQEIF